jgi:hypothetical protein
MNLSSSATSGGTCGGGGNVSLFACSTPFYLGYLGALCGATNWLLCTVFTASCRAGLKNASSKGDMVHAGQFRIPSNTAVYCFRCCHVAATLLPVMKA